VTEAFPEDPGKKVPETERESEREREDLQRKQTHHQCEA
jgi:hypothetical protein